MCVHTPTNKHTPPQTKHIQTSYVQPLTQYVYYYREHALSALFPSHSALETVAYRIYTIIIVSHKCMTQMLQCFSAIVIPIITPHCKVVLVDNNHNIIGRWTAGYLLKYSKVALADNNYWQLDHWMLDNLTLGHDVTWAQRPFF